MDDLHLAHLSDTHFGREQFRATTASGANQRGADIVHGARRAVSGILDADPPLVLHAGDVSDTTMPKLKYWFEAKRQFTQLAGLRADGTRRQLVICPGNHEQPADVTEPCWLDVFGDLPGVHVAGGSYDRITFDDADNPPPELADTVVHVIPHSGLAALARDGKRGGAGFDQVRPVDGKRNILMTHGVAEGSELFYRAIGKEHPVPGEVLRRDWDYVALGHYHKSGPVQPGSSVINEEKPSRVWYSGSPETITLSDVEGRETTERYWLDVVVRRGELPAVTRKPIAVRRIVYLPDVNADGLTQEQITAQLRTNLDAAAITESVVVQKVLDVSPEVWATTDRRLVREAAEASALVYELRAVYKRGHPDVAERDHTVGMGDLPRLLGEGADAEGLTGEHREAVLAAARSHLDAALAETVTSDDD